MQFFVEHGTNKCKGFHIISLVDLVFQVLGDTILAYCVEHDWDGRMLQ